MEAESIWKVLDNNSDCVVAVKLDEPTEWTFVECEREGIWMTPKLLA